MKAKGCKRAACLLAALLILLSPCLSALAANSRSTTRYTNPETGNRVDIIDEEHLLTKEEKEQLADEMKDITQYGSIAFWSVRKETGNDVNLAKQRRQELYGNKSSGIFVINMATRKVTFQSAGKINTIITASYARSLTDNVSEYASNGDYYTCAEQAMDQVYELLQGNRIAQPMKYISAIVIGLMIAFILTVGIVFGKKNNPLVKPADDEVKLVNTGSVQPQAHRTIRLAVKADSFEGSDFACEIVFEILSFVISGGGSGGGSSGGSGGSSSF